MNILTLWILFLLVGGRVFCLYASELEGQDVAPASQDSLSDYSRYPYIRILGYGETPQLSDEEFYDLAGRIVFTVNKYDYPKNDSLLLQLEREVLPRINRDSLQLAYVMLRGAASPEGPTRWNDFLGHERAKVLLNFLSERLKTPIDENRFEEQIDIEDYRTLCIMMRRAGDPDYTYVQTLCDRCLPDRMSTLKTALQNAWQGRLWRRILHRYFPALRAARVVLFFRRPVSNRHKVLPAATLETLPYEVSATFPETLWRLRLPSPLAGLRVPRREVLSVKSNLLFDFAYVPGYNRWCPIPNVAVEYFPLKGHFTFGASIDFPWWQHYSAHKYFQIRNYQLEARYYLRSGSIDKNPPGLGAAFRGLYAQAYVHGGLFGICFDADRGWVGEGFGGGLGVGYVLPLTRRGHWRMEFGAQFGYFTCRYDPYKYENPVDPSYRDDLYYYKWQGRPEDFKKRQYRFNWFGPTRVGITLSYDILYRRVVKKGISINPTEPYPAQ